jgi:hypothetical protein
MLRQDVHTNALLGSDPTKSRYRPEQAHEVRLFLCVPGILSVGTHAIHHPFAIPAHL